MGPSSEPAPSSEGDSKLSEASAPAGFRERCQRVPDPRCNDRAEKQCEKVNQGESPAKVCLFRGDGRDADKSGDHNSVGE